MSLTKSCEVIYPFNGSCPLYISSQTEHKASLPSRILIKSGFNARCYWAHYVMIKEMTRNTSVEVLLIGFDWWEVGLLIFDEPPFMCLTPTYFISKFADLLTLSFISVFDFKPCETARSSWTFASSMASWNLWTLFEMFGFLIASSTNTRNSRWASLALPDEPKIDDLTLTCAPRMQ